jgi:hypothetical protein
MNSTGALMEHKVARKEGIPMVFDLDELEAWLNSEGEDKS